MNMSVLVPEAAGTLRWIHLLPKVSRKKKKKSGLTLLLLTRHIISLPEKA